MLNNYETEKHARKRRTEVNEVRLLVLILFPCFFVAAVCRRALSAGMPASGGERRRLSCFEDARRATYSVIPYTMMR